MHNVWPIVNPHDVEPASRRVCVRVHSSCQVVRWAAQCVLTLSHAAAQSVMLCILVTTGTVARVLGELHVQRRE